MAEKKGKPYGPKPERLRVDEERWEDAVKKALTKKRPTKGQPKPPKPPK